MYTTYNAGNNIEYLFFVVIVHTLYNSRTLFECFLLLIYLLLVKDFIFSFINENDHTLNPRGPILII